MKFDFESDLKKELWTEFDGYGIKLPVRNRIDKYLLDYLTVCKKLIRPKPRNVLYNPDFSKELDKHSKKDEIKHLELLFTKGYDVNFFQSKRLFQSNFHDHLAYEWNIHHLHLSKEKEKKGKFVKQVKQLLFVYVNDDRAIFLGTDNHTPGTFGDVKWQEVLHDHFPETIEPYLDKQIVKSYPDVNSSDRQTLWNKGYTLGMTNIRDKVYHNPGIGRSTSGHSVLVTKQVNEIMRWLFTITDQFNTYYSDICKLLNIDTDTPKFILRFGDKTLEIYENHSKQIVLTYPQIVNEELFQDSSK